MEFVETKTFTKLIHRYLTDDEFNNLQVTLACNPEIGDIIRNTGGLRKVRWKIKGKGKRGGTKFIIGINQRIKFYY